jgi:hypothetical protein
VLEEHRAWLRTVFSSGREVDSQGDSLFYAFGRADDAVAGAAAGQRALEGLPIRVRMGVHTGQPSIVGDRYVGLDVHRAARICAAAHGGQVLLSQLTRDLAEATTRDLGEHRLKDLTQPQRLHQLVAERLEKDFPPLRTLEIVSASQSSTERGSFRSSARSSSPYATLRSAEPSRCVNATSSRTAFSTSSSETVSVGVWM